MQIVAGWSATPDRVVPTGMFVGAEALSDDVVSATIVSELEPADAKGHTDDIRAAVGQLPGAQVNVTGQHANVLVRKKIGDEIDGMFCGLPGYKLKITGGSDKDGFPMRPEIPSSGRKRILVSRSRGYKPNRKLIRKKRTFRTTGNRRKKTFRGNEISPDTLQINTVVTHHGPKTLQELAPKKEEKKA